MRSPRRRDVGRGIPLVVAASVVAVVAVLAGVGLVAGAADEPPSIRHAVEYDGAVEVVFADGVVSATDGSSLDAGDFTLVVDGTAYEPGTVAVADGNEGEAVRFALSEFDGLGDVGASRNLTVVASDVQATGHSDRTAAELTAAVDVTGPVVDAGADDHTRPSDAATVYVGEPIAVRNAATAGAWYDIRDVTDSKTIQGGSLSENATAFALSTEDLDPGHTYRIDYDGGGERYFETAELDLAAEASDVNCLENLTVDVSAAGGERRVTVELVREDDARTVGTESIVLDERGRGTVSFSLDHPGYYSVTVTDREIGLQSTADDIEVSSIGYCGESWVAFDDHALFTHANGNLATIPVEFTETDRATVVVGDASAGYWLRAHVTDGDGDGEAVIGFDSRTAGAGDDGATVVRAVDGDDSVERVESGGDFADGVDAPDDDSLDPARYPVNVTVGHNDEPHAGPPDDRGTLALDEQSQGSIGVMRAPAEADVSELDVDDVREGYAEDVTSAEEVAVGDHLLFVLEGTGVDDYVGHRDGDTTESFLAALDRGEAPAFAVDQQNPGTHSLPKRLLLSPGDTTVVSDRTDDAYVVAIDTGSVETDRRSFRRYDDYAAILTLGTGDEPNRTRSDHVEAVEREVRLDAAADGPSLRAVSNQTIGGETTLAPGTDLLVRVSEDEPGSGTTFERSTTVQPDGTFAATFDFAALSSGANVSVSVVDPLTVEPIEGGDDVSIRLEPNSTATEDPSTAASTEADSRSPSLPTPSNGSLPGDVDADGHPEDLDGDGDLTRDDARTLFDHRDDPAVTDNVEVYDVTGNGRIDLADVVELYRDVVAST